MTYSKRLDGRKFDETRPIEAKAGIIKRADGSGYFKIGNTIAYAAVYGPRNLYPKFLQNPEKGILRVNYNMMPFSSLGGRVRPGSNRRAREISLVAEKALLPVINLDEFPNSVVDVFIELPQTDAGTRCAGICAASIALADAGISMKDLVAAVAVGMVDDKVVVDLSYDEEAYEAGATDITIAMIPRKKEELMKAIEMAKKTLKKINEKQREALKLKYEIK